MKKKIISLFIFTILLGLAGAGYNFYSNARKTPEGAIRLYLASEGHFIDAIKAEVKISDEEPWKGKYYCENVKSGPDFYSMYQKEDNLWYINESNSGGA